MFTSFVCLLAVRMVSWLIGWFIRLFICFLDRFFVSVSFCLCFGLFLCSCVCFFVYFVLFTFFFFFLMDFLEGELCLFASLWCGFFELFGWLAYFVVLFVLLFMLLLLFLSFFIFNDSLTDKTNSETCHLSPQYGNCALDSLLSSIVLPCFTNYSAFTTVTFRLVDSSP